MADQTWLASTLAKSAATINGDEVFRVVDDPSGTPASKRVTVDGIAPRVGEVIKSSPLLLHGTTGTNMRMVSPVGVGFTSATVNTGRLYCVPVHFGKNRTLTEVGIYVNTLAASGVARLGLYEDAGGVPGAFVADFGEVLTSTTGHKAISISQAVLGTKWYWWAINTGVANPVLVVATTPIMHFGGLATGTAGTTTTMFQSLAYGALPTGDQSGASYSRTTGAIAFYYL